MSRTVVVTGAEGDIGRATCALLSREGYLVEGLDRRSSGPREHPVTQADLTDESAVDTVFEQIAQRSSGLYGLVCCAGVYEALDATTTSVVDLERVWRGNVLTAWLAAAAFARHAVDGGRIVTLASISGRNGSHDVAYGSAKGAVLGLTRSLALHLAPRLRVNAVSPGLVAGAMADRVPAERRDAYRDASALGRLGTPDDVAHAVLALMGPAGDWMTGSVLDIDGGTP